MCTVFTGPEKRNFVAKSYESFLSHGMVFGNQRDVRKKSLNLPGTRELFWTSRYGNVTFSQCGKGMPVNGMNERGLVVEQATLPGTTYPPVDDRPEISCLEAIQFVLDTCESTKEAIEAFKTFRISGSSWGMHYFVSDGAGETAVIEFTDGDAKVFGNAGDPVLTNIRYGHIAGENAADRHEENNPYADDSRERARRISLFIRDKGELSVQTCFDALRLVKGADTVWQCVYDIANRSVYFESVHSPTRHKIDMAIFDFSRPGQRLLLDLSEAKGDMNFVPYSRRENRKNIEGFYGNRTIIELMKLPGSDFIINALDTHIDEIETGACPAAAESCRD